MKPPRDRPDVERRATPRGLSPWGTPREVPPGSNARPLFSRGDEARITELVVECAGPEAEAAFQRIQADAIQAGSPIPAAIAAEVLHRLGFYRRIGP